MIGYQLRVEAGAHDEVAARSDHLVDLGGGGDVARAHQHIGAGLLHELDGRIGSGGAEGDLRDGYAARAEGFAELGGVALRVVELDDRHHADGADLFVHGIHVLSLLQF